MYDVNSHNMYVTGMAEHVVYLFVSSSQLDGQSDREVMVASRGSTQLWWSLTWTPAKDMIENWRVKNEANFKKAEQKRRESLGFRKDIQIRIERDIGLSWIVCIGKRFLRRTSPNVDRWSTWIPNHLQPLCHGCPRSKRRSSEVWWLVSPGTVPVVRWSPVARSWSRFWRPGRLQGPHPITTCLLAKTVLVRWNCWLLVLCSQESLGSHGPGTCTCCELRPVDFDVFFEELTQPVGGGSRLLPMLEGVKKRGNLGRFQISWIHMDLPVLYPTISLTSVRSSSKGWAKCRRQLAAQIWVQHAKKSKNWITAGGSEGGAEQPVSPQRETREEKNKRLKELMAAADASRDSLLG